MKLAGVYADGTSRSRQPPCRCQRDVRARLALILSDSEERRAHLRPIICRHVYFFTAIRDALTARFGQSALPYPFMISMYLHTCNLPYLLPLPSRAMIHIASGSHVFRPEGDVADGISIGDFRVTRRARLAWQNARAYSFLMASRNDARRFVA